MKCMRCGIELIGVSCPNCGFNNAAGTYNEPSTKINTTPAKDDDVALSMLVGAATGSSIIGAATGGSFLGGYIGASMSSDDSSYSSSTSDSYDSGSSYSSD